MSTTQVALIKAHLQAGKTITPASALAVYGIYRLSSVIEDLRNSGMEIDTLMKWDEMGKQYGEYRLRRPLVRGSAVQVRRGYGMGLPRWVRSLKHAKVIGKVGDTSLVRFTRGKNLADEWLNDKELVNVD
ncbi:MAG: hypothetical protein GXC94_02200 [Comamonadaceae bacterium]|jgi:hypothetical protein|nr:hypothetical protein [Comamonadaceae bacterium]